MLGLPSSTEDGSRTRGAVKGNAMRYAQLKGIDEPT
jgi:hypothetical protein